jgi:oligopeptide transport system ATP-binding protein
MDSPPLLQVKDLRVTFKKGTQQTSIIRGVSFNIYQGETLAIVGASGSGKSITAQALMRLLDPHADITGEILLQGEGLLTKSEKEMRQVRGKKIGMIFQDPSTSLNPTMKI